MKLVGPMIAILLGLLACSSNLNKANPMHSGRDGGLHDGDSSGAGGKDAMVVETDTDTVSRVATGGGGYWLVLSHGALYMSAADDGTISKIAMEGGPPAVVAKGQEPFHLFACGDTVCWVEGGALGHVMQLDSGGNPITIIPEVDEIQDAVFDGSNFFIAEGAGGLALYRVAASGGDLVTIATDAASLALDDDCLYWAGSSGIWSWSRSAADVATGS